MQRVGVSAIKVETRAGITRVAIKVDSSVTELSASLFAHEMLAV